jgi:uncharacterized protein (TIGR03083 family)
MEAQTNIPIDVIDLLPILDKKLLELLKTLTPDEWNKQTIAKLWTVKDVVAHLLDTNMRTIASANNYSGKPPENIQSYDGLVSYLNELNAVWVKAMDRVSPGQLITLLETTGEQYYNYLASLDPFATAKYSVLWAGEEHSENWFHIAREYTEKWHHQQQIRDAVSKPALMTRELFYPFIDIFMLALPFTYRTIEAEEGTIVKVTVTTDIGGAWFLTRRNNNWKLTKDNLQTAAAEIIIDPDTSWKLFSKSLRPEQIMDKVKILGPKKLVEATLTMVSVMA